MASSSVIMVFTKYMSAAPVYQKESLNLSLSSKVERRGSGNNLNLML
jgi:hypothetical protein